MGREHRKNVGNQWITQGHPGHNLWITHEAEIDGGEPDFLIAKRSQKRDFREWKFCGTSSRGSTSYAEV